MSETNGLQDSTPDSGAAGPEQTAPAHPVSKTRVRIGVGLLIGSFVPFVLSGWLAAVADKGTTHVGALVMICYAISVVMWYAGILIGGEVMLRKVKGWRAARKSRHTAARADGTDRDGPDAPSLPTA